MLEGVHLCDRCEQDTEISWSYSTVVTGDADNVPARAIIGGIDGEGVSDFEARFIGGILADDDNVPIVRGKPATGEYVSRVELCVQLDAGELSIPPARGYLILAQFLYPACTWYRRKDTLKITKWLRLGGGNHHIKAISSVDPVEQRIE